MKYLQRVLLTTGEAGYIGSELPLDKKWLVVVGFASRFVHEDEIITI